MVMKAAKAGDSRFAASWIAAMERRVREVQRWRLKLERKMPGRLRVIVLERMFVSQTKVRRWCRRKELGDWIH